MSDFSDEESKATTQKETKLKKENSYTYWVNNDPNFFKGGPKTDSLPKPINPSELLKLTGAEDATKSNPSAWNTAQTWEERKLEVKAIIEVLETKMLNFTTSDGKAKIVQLQKCEGDAKVVLSRGKKRLGYNLTIHYNYEGTGDKSSSTGSIKLKDFQDDGDYLVAVESTEDDGIKESITSSLGRIVQDTYDVINKLKDN